jgi:hypothetical protein
MGLHGNPNAHQSHINHHQSQPAALSASIHQSRGCWPACLPCHEAVCVCSSSSSSSSGGGHKQRASISLAEPTGEHRGGLQHSATSATSLFFSRFKENRSLILRFTTHRRCRRRINVTPENQCAKHPSSLRAFFLSPQLCALVRSKICVLHRALQKIEYEIMHRAKRCHQRPQPQTWPFSRWGAPSVVLSELGGRSGSWASQVIKSYSICDGVDGYRYCLVSWACMFNRLGGRISKAPRQEMILGRQLLVYGGICRTRRGDVDASCYTLRESWTV